jgi:hypothetical protein
MNTTTPHEGDIVLAIPSGGVEKTRPPFVLVVKCFDNHASCSLLTLRTDLATHLDVILPKEMTGLGAPAVIHSFAGTKIPYARLSTPIAVCPPEVVAEVMRGRFGTPSPEYEHGREIEPIFDRRLRQLTYMYREFQELIGMTDSEIAPRV